MVCDRYVDFCLERIRLLQHYDIKPIFVFDGGPLPSKRGTEDDRHKSPFSFFFRCMAIALLT